MAFGLLCRTSVIYADLPGDNRALEPPDSIPNSEEKRCIADGSVGFPHVRVGHRQASKIKKSSVRVAFFFVFFKPDFAIRKNQHRCLSECL